MGPPSRVRVGEVVIRGKDRYCLQHMCAEATSEVGVYLLAQPPIPLHLASYVPLLERRMEYHGQDRKGLHYVRPNAGGQPIRGDTQGAEECPKGECELPLEATTGMEAFDRLGVEVTEDLEGVAVGVLLCHMLGLSEYRSARCGAPLTPGSPPGDRAASTLRRPLGESSPL